MSDTAEQTAHEQTTHEQTTHEQTTPEQTAPEPFTLDMAKTQVAHLDDVDPEADTEPAPPEPEQAAPEETSETDPAHPPKTSLEDLERELAEHDEEIKRSAKIYEAQRQAKQLQMQLEAAEKARQESEQMIARLKSNPLEVLDEFGLPLDRLAEMQLGADPSGQQPAQQTALERKLAKMEQLLQDQQQKHEQWREQEEKAKQEAETRRMMEANMHMLQTAAAADPEVGKIAEVVGEPFLDEAANMQVRYFASTGKHMPHARAVQLAAKDLRASYERLHAIFGASSDTPPSAPPAKQQPVKTPTTLGQQMDSTPGTAGEQSEEDRIAAAKAALAKLST